MNFKITKYCVMTADLQKVEVGQSRQYHFVPLQDVINNKCKAPIKLFNSFKTAKSSFACSFWAKWNEELQGFTSIGDKNNELRYVIKQIDIDYDLKGVEL